jgi:phosphoribosylformylglycinamidine cyclo-ligase
LDRVAGLAHITGGGIPGNLPRSLADGCGAKIDKSSWSIPPLFRLLQDGGKVEEAEMFRVFNMGVGMIAAAPNDQVDAVCSAAADAGINAWVVGEVVSGEGVEIA